MVKCPSSTSTITLCRTSPKVPIWMASAKLGNLPTRSSDSTAKKYPGHILLILSITQYCTYYSTPSGNSGIPTSLAEKKLSVWVELNLQSPWICPGCFLWFSDVPNDFPIFQWFFRGVFPWLSHQNLHFFGEFRLRLRDAKTKGEAMVGGPQSRSNFTMKNLEMSQGFHRDFTWIYNML